MIASAEIEEKASDLACYIHVEVYRKTFIGGIILKLAGVSDSEVFPTVTVRSFRRLNHIVRIPVSSQTTTITITMQLILRYRVEGHYFPIDNTR